MFSAALRRLEQQMRSLFDELAFVKRELNEVQKMRSEVSELSRRISRFPQPIRPNWVRSSAPAWELETLPLPDVSVVRTSTMRSRIAPLPAPIIHRVTVELLGDKDQYVRAYDERGQAIPRYCGRFRDVGVRVLEAAHGLRWEVVSAQAA